MTVSEVMKELRKLGTAQNRKVYRRHGSGDNLYGVSFANLRKLQRKIKTDNDLAAALWKTGNADARSLAILIADPRSFPEKTAEAWVGDIRYYLLSDLLAGLVARAPYAARLMKKWMRSREEFVRQCGYDILSCLLRDGAEISDAACARFLSVIEKNIHRSPNRSRHAMNMALIAIGGYRSSLTSDAVAAARRIGKVEVDHGETECKTPDAEAYIGKMRKKRKKARAAARR